MKINEAVKIFDERWIRKPLGFRVHFQKYVESEIITDYSPEKDDKPLDSDVVAWRLAWKLSQVWSKEEAQNEPAFYNIYVVDDLDKPIDYYVTGRPEIFNPMPFP